jgi:S1-C subfamily serine protease
MQLRLLNAGLALCASLALGACTTSYTMVGSFNNSDDIYVGKINRDVIAGSAALTIESRDSGKKCSGTVQLSHVPADRYVAGIVLFPACGGEQGNAQLVCDGERTVKAKWSASACDTGTGHGTDQNGVMFNFAFGVDGAQTAIAALATKRAQSNRDPVKPAKESGFNTGSGFFVSNSGHFVTNYHVIDGSTNVVAVVRGEELPATVVKSDKSRDIAILKVEAETPWLPIEQTNDVSRGEDVFTLGYPFIAIQGQQQKASFGRVNALSGIKDNERYMQIDVPIQPGNSGGPLINERGHVIGVITSTLDSMATLRRMGAIPQNVNYALKSDYLLPLLEDVLEKSGESVRAVHGMKGLVSTAERAVVLVIAR